MKTSLLLLLLSLSILTSGCGGGESSPSPSSGNPITPIAVSNLAWDNARVYKPYSTSPSSVAELNSMPPGPVAISLHGCDGVNNTTDPNYFPLLLASFGYLVIEPDSYFGDKVGSFGSLLCDGFNIPQGAWANMPNRVKDAEYAVAKVKAAPYWNQKTLLVQGQSQGAVVLANFPSIEGATKILWTGYNCPDTYLATSKAALWLPTIPKLVVNSLEDPWGAGWSRCDSKYNWQIEIIPGSEHNPQRNPLGLKLITEFVKIY